MNVKRFTARTSREAMALVRQAFGDDAVVLSNKPCAEGVEVLAMAPEGMSQIERVAATAPRVSSPSRVAARPAQAQPQAPAEAPRGRLAARLAERHEPGFGNEVNEDVNTLAMSTLSFQDYVRERMLKRRQAELQGQQDPMLADPMLDDRAADPVEAEGVSSLAALRQQRAQAAMQAMNARRVDSSSAPQAAAPRVPPVLRDEIRVPDVRQALTEMPSLSDIPSASRRDQQDMMNELRSMKGMIEERFGALAFMEKLQRQPAQARLTQRLLEVGFSPALVRKLVEGCPAHLAEDKTGSPDENQWAANVLARNLLTDEAMPALEEQGGVFAMIGSTGVGKTTTTAKIAAAFATRHGAGQLGLITLDAYRVGAHEQLRAYGRILGVPVHTAHDRASLEDLLELLSAKKMVLIDTAGMAQRDTRTRELLDMLAHASVKKILVVNAAQQGETIDDVVAAWRASECQGVVLSKIDEAVKLGPALDTMIRHKLRIIGVANGQRVPEDWHRLSAQALVQRAMRSQPTAAWRMDNADVNLIFAGGPALATGIPAAMGVH
ncbi:flagellar biosynthesis protein FlhF [Paucibacter sediminis]|uniref:Flagellar biosynthesis protein FlhF n=1 Tax=Paucibacter sediminis TaxID=3019553 RepID=A0AA95NDP1_9BURK|nr:flagellar biosynthesis protein FlhF [Paucibacter sp. S2-9]WIT10319.1 flagellar biosynthesis protein FlhF [Paucibacter sp. S2-9]